MSTIRPSNSHEGALLHTRGVQDRLQDIDGELPYVDCKEVDAVAQPSAGTVQRHAAKLS